MRSRIYSPPHTSIERYAQDDFFDRHSKLDVLIYRRLGRTALGAVWIEIRVMPSGIIASGIKVIGHNIDKIEMLLSLAQVISLQVSPKPSRSNRAEVVFSVQFSHRIQSLSKALQHLYEVVLILWPVRIVVSRISRVLPVKIQSV